MVSPQMGSKFALCLNIVKKVVNLLMLETSKLAWEL